MEVCTNPEILRIVLFVVELLKIVLFVIPIGLIVMLMIDFSKNVIAGKEDDMKKNVSIAIKRIIYCVVLFLVPTIVSFANSILGDLGVDYVQCFNNANIEYIEARTVEIANETLSTAMIERTMDSVYDAESAISRISDDSVKESLMQQISTLKEEIKIEMDTKDKDKDKDKAPTGSSSNGSNSSTGFKNYGSGTSGKYFAPVQGVKFNIGGYNGTPGCSNSGVSHDITGINKGTPIYAGMDGVAEFKYTFSKINGKEVLTSYGNQIKITNKNGTYIIYAHLDGFASEIFALKRDTCNYPCPASKYKSISATIAKKEVKKGDLIGYLGSTGNSSGPHLHVEIHENGDKVCVKDPWEAFGMK